MFRFTYCQELNKHVKDDKIFKFVSRISGDRLCVVLEKAEQATMLVEQIGAISVNNEVVPIKYLVAKSKKVIVSNAGYSISNSALKKFLKDKCNIRTASSVSELKANMDSEGTLFQNTRSFRRAVYIHPEDDHKLPKGPVKFATSSIAFNVFFDIENPKCFLCGESGHFRASCPENNEKKTSNKEDPNKEVNDSQNALILPATPLSDNIAKEADVNDKSQIGENSDRVAHNLLPDFNLYDNDISFSQESSKENNLEMNKISKRALSDISSEKSAQEKKVSTSDKNLHEAHSLQQSIERATLENNKPAAKKLKKEENQSTEEKIISNLEPARAFIETTKEKHLLEFEKLAELLVKASKEKSSDKKRKIALNYTVNTPELIILLSSIYSLADGKGLKAKITTLKNALEVENENGTASQSDPGNLQT